MFYTLALILGAAAVVAGLIAESGEHLTTWVIAIVCAVWCAIFTFLGTEEENAPTYGEDYDGR